VAEDLAERVDTLGHHLDVSQRQVRRMRWLTALTAVLAVLAVVGAIFSAYLYQEVDEVVEQNTTNAVQACRNGNESRAASAALWGFIIDLSLADGGESPDQRVALEQLRTWITQLFAPRDCSDLSRKYPLPEPPPIIERLRESR
jgi:cell division protein FtsB